MPQYKNETNRAKKREREATARFGWSIMQTSKRYFFYLVQLQRYTNKHTEAHTQHNH